MVDKYIDDHYMLENSVRVEQLWGNSDILDTNTYTAR